MATRKPKTVEGPEIDDAPREIKLIGQRVEPALDAEL